MSRQLRGSGTFSRTATGEWCLRVAVTDDLGNRTRPRFYGATQAECRVLAEEYRHSLRMGLAPRRAESMASYMTRWLQEREVALRPSTHRRYRQHIEQDILPTLSKLDVEEVTRQHVLTMQRRIVARGSSVRTANHAKNVLGAALQDALRDGLVTLNAARLVKGLPAPDFSAVPLTASDIEKMRDAIRGTREEALYGLALAYGLRQSELLGLTWEDIDFESGILHVRRALHDRPLKDEPRRYSLTDLKTRSSRRSMAMPEHVRSLLLEQRTRQGVERGKAGEGWQDYWPNLVFRGRTGRPMDGRTVTRSFQYLQKKLGISPIRRFHDLRHGAAAFLLLSGVDLKVISQILGHSSITITADVYSHVLPQLQLDALEKLGKIWEPSATR